jgi:Trk K+ transport system NAD-binding subunit
VDQGVLVLGIYRPDGEFVGAPNKDTRVEEQDILLVYGKDVDVRAIFEL